ncbi:MAG TPA: hypothetical protein VFX02_10600 [Gammaproteobacteria bacterium]|nr:hypothetical protein [Gammaproteobacteria bacterium]
MAVSFVNADNFKHAWRALALSLLALGLYVWHDPDYPPNGGTWLGYTLGTVSFLLLLWLMWYGVRKRRYSGGESQLKSWLSAHVYFGLALALIVSLHSGFQMGWNVHSLAYVLLLLEITSGIYGVYAYLRYPRAMTDNLNNQTRESLLESVDQIDRECVDIAGKLGGQAPLAISRLIENTQVGGNARAQLWPLIEKTSVPKELSALFDQVKAEESRDRMAEMQKTLAFFNPASLTQGAQAKTGHMHKLMDLLAQRKQLLDRIRRHIRYKAWLNIWLYVHVPLAFAVLAAVIVHIISVFFYW